MADLRTNFKDDIYSGNRKYIQTTNEDGTVSFSDSTIYEQKGDSFGANELNAITAEVNKKAHKSTVVNATLLATNWAGTSAPYTQTINVAGITINSNATVSISPSATTAQYNAGVDGMLHPSSQVDGAITIKAFDSKPTVDVPITVLILG